jgi:hypothetical protein
MFSDEHPACQPEDNFTGCDACGVFKGEKGSHAKPTPSIVNGLGGRQYAGFEFSDHLLTLSIFISTLRAEERIGR